MRKLYEGNIRRNFFIFAFPLILTALFSQAYSIINTIMAGKLIGDNAISAIGSTAPFVSLPCIGLAPGANASPCFLPSGVEPVFLPYDTFEVIVKIEVVIIPSR